MPHMTTPVADSLIDQDLEVLDKGFVRLVDYMGGDQRITDSARVSYQGGTKQVREDSQLIRYLLRHKHTTPFEKVRFEFHVKLPIFVARQWMRHRMGTFNELSARYSVMPDEFYYPDQYRTQSTTNKQGSGGVLEPPENAVQHTLVKELCEDAYFRYQQMLKAGVTREQARMVLPVNIYTQFYWTVDLWNLMHFMKLRSDSHAQWEIQEYSRRLEMCVEAVCPNAYAAFIDYHRDSQTFSGPETTILTDWIDSKARAHSENVGLTLEIMCKDRGMTTRTPSGKLSREFQEFLGKLNVDRPE